MAIIYTELRQRTIDGLVGANESTFLANLDQMIASAEERIYYLMEMPAFRLNVSGILNANNPYLLLPVGFRYSHELFVGSGATGAYLMQKDVSFIREVYPDPTVTGPPRHYAQFDDTAFILGPTPDQSYPTELHCDAMPVSITQSIDGTSWLGENASNALLYGTLIEGAIFLNYDPEDATYVEYKTHFDLDAGTLKGLTENLTQNDSYRDGQRRKSLTSRSANVGR